MIVYLHGFNSAYNPDSDKIVALSKLDKVYPLSYNSFDTYDNILDDIITKTKHLENLVFVGTSLGGFYAAACASALGVPCVLINPVSRGSFVQNNGIFIKDVPMTNYVTGQVNAVTQTMIDSYINLDIKELHYECKPLLLLDMEDELIDSQNTLDHLKSIVSSSSVYYEGGSHRFDHIDLALRNIEYYLNNFFAVSHWD
tara:strand:+ start:279 stop:875 length:597 start_codon:yes stop_codon:yes gene_type:complete